MNYLYIVLLCLFSVAGLLHPVDISEAMPSALSTGINKQAVYQLLEAGEGEEVRSLPRGDREILLAVMAMDQGQTKKALGFLGAEAVKKNRLAALIRAEAYRRQSVQAAERAGHYAHAANGDIGRLKQARISAGLDEANQRLHTFMVSLNTSGMMMSEQLELHPMALEEKPVSMPSVASQMEIEPVKVTAWPSIVGRPANIAVAMAENRANVGSVSKASTMKVVRATEAKRQQVKVAAVKVKPVKVKQALVKPVRVKAVKAKVRPAVRKQEKRMKSIRESLEMWRKDWQSRDSGAYFSHYHKAFETDKYTYKTWVAHKRRVNAKKSYIKVRLSHVKISPNGRYKKRGEVVLVSFDQQYKSSNYNATSHKKLYMARKHAGDPWLILREE